MFSCQNFNKSHGKKLLLIVIEFSSFPKYFANFSFPKIYFVQPFSSEALIVEEYFIFIYKDLSLRKYVGGYTEVLWYNMMYSFREKNRNFHKHNKS